MVRMSADSAQLRKDMQRASNSVAAMERRMASAASAIKAGFAGISLAQMTREFTQASDAYTKLNSRIKLVTGSAEEQAAVEKALFASAQRTRSGYEGTVELYTRVARNADQLGASQAELLQLTESVNKAIQIGGSTAQEASAGVIQFSQALASGELRGEELRSVMENMPRLAEAIAKGLEKTGVATRVTLGDMRKLSQDGELTAERIFKALLSQTTELDSEFSQLGRTVGQAMTQLGNDVQRAMAKADMKPLLDAIDGLRDALTDPATLQAITQLGTTLAQSIQLALIPLREAVRLVEWFRRNKDFAAGESATMQSGDQKRMQDRIAMLRERLDNSINFGAEQRGFRLSDNEMRDIRAEIMRLEKARRELSAAAAPEPDLTVKPPPAKMAPTVSSGKSERQSAEEQRLRSIKSIIDALEKENATLSMTVSGLAEYELASLGADASTIAYAKSLAAATEMALADVEASEQAQRAREELAAEIESIAAETFAALMTEDAAMRTAAARREEIVRQAVADHIIAEERGAAIIAGIHEKLNQDIQARAEETKDAFTKFAEEAAANIQDAMADTLFNWMQGEFGNIANDFKKMLDRMVANALAARIGEALFGAGFGGSGGGELGGLFGKIAGIFGGKRASGGPVSAGRAYLVGEKGPELMVPSGMGRIIPNHELSGGGGVVVNIAISGVQDARGLRESANQVAARSGQAVQRALARNT